MMLIYGGGGHAKVLISCLQSAKMDISGVFDDNPHAVVHHGVPYLGTYRSDIYPNKLLVLGMGDISVRIRLAALVKHDFGQIMHPSALIDTSVSFGMGGVALQGAIVQAGCIIGKQVIINTKASVDHDCRIGDHVHLAPGAIVCGGVSVAANTLVGAGSVLVPGISVGSGCYIAAGSILTHSFPDGSLVRGNPARRIGSYQLFT